MVVSSTKANPASFYDNAEAGWSTLKTELLPSGSPFASLEEAASKWVTTSAGAAAAR